MKQVILGLAVVATLGLSLFPVLAHNAGHIHTPNGECMDVGSGKHAHNPDKQDKIEGPGDQYGARWAAEQEGTPIEPRHCDEAHPDASAEADTP